VPAKPLRYRTVALKEFTERRREELRATEDDLERNVSRLIASVAPRSTPGPTANSCCSEGAKSSSASFVR